MTKVLELLEKELPKYIHEVKSKKQENAKAFAFSSFMQRVFDVESKDLDFEKSVKTEVMQMKGRIDAVFGNVIIEFKKDLSSGLEIAKEELLKYFQAYLEKSETNFLGIANDGINFKVFYPIIKSNQVTDIEEIDEINLEKSSVKEIFLWFDSYFFSTEKIIPTSEDIKRRFGLDSPTFATIHRKLEELFEKALIDKRTEIKFQSWNRYLEIVYGDKPNEKKLFFKHTYLSTFVKLLVHIKITGGKPRTFDEITPILYGDTFERSGIKNFMEEDFFLWILAPNIKKQSSKLFHNLLQEIYVYDLEKIDEDVLKELYQELVDPDVRKLLGEFYTPDWLAQSMVKEILEKEPTKSVMDPACGSGTFLFKTIQFKIESLSKMKWSKDKILEHIVDNVIGFDVHPLAVIISRTNYLLALKDIIHAKKGSISIPVYLSDSLKIPTKRMDVSTATHTFEFTALDKKFQFPISIASDLSKMDQVVEALHEYGQEFELKIENQALSKFSFDPNEYAKNTLIGFEKMMSKKFNDSEIKILIQSLETLYDLIRRQEDAIWPYVLRNMYKPIAIAFKKVDVIIGNPPWIAQQAMHDKEYKKYLKEKSLEYKLAGKKDVHNIPNMELASLFFCHCVAQYLSNEGIIGFVMPRSVLDASQHIQFRKFHNPSVELFLVYDLKKVKPLFRIPSCVIFAQKDKPTIYPVKSIELKGQLNSSNEQLIDADRNLDKKTSEFTPVTRERNNSVYHKKFRKGADLIPRIFWYVDIKSDSFLGFNPENPHVISSQNRFAKKPWSELLLDGNVAKKFLFNTIVATDLVPFGILQRRLVFLPILIKDNKIEILDSSEHSEIIHSDTSKYLQDVEKIWKKHSKGTASEMTPYQWIDYQNKLSKQKPMSKFKVVYAGSATYMTACVLKPNKKYSFDIDGTSFDTDRFITDVATYYFDTNDEKEANYLAAIFNSKILDDLIKPEQSKGDFGPRNIHKLPLTFNIPLFDSSSTQHMELANLGMECAKKVAGLFPEINSKSIGVIRKKLREALDEDYRLIDDIVKRILKD